MCLGADWELKMCLVKKKDILFPGGTAALYIYRSWGSGRCLWLDRRDATPERSVMGCSGLGRMPRCSLGMLINYV